MNVRNDAGMQAIQAMKIGDSIARVRRVDIKKFNEEDCDVFCRNQQTAIGIAAKRAPGIEITTERFEAITRNREHIVFGVVATRIA